MKSQSSQPPSLSRWPRRASRHESAFLPLSRGGAPVVVAAFPKLGKTPTAGSLRRLSRRMGTELVVAPALAQDQIAKLMANPGQPPYDALLVSPGQTADAATRGLIEKIDPTKLKNWSKLDPGRAERVGPIRHHRGQRHRLQSRGGRQARRATRRCSRIRTMPARSPRSASARTPRPWPGPRSPSSTAAPTRTCSRSST